MNRNRPLAELAATPEKLTQGGTGTHGHAHLLCVHTISLYTVTPVYDVFETETYGVAIPFTVENRPQGTII